MQGGLIPSHIFCGSADCMYAEMTRLVGPKLQTLMGLPSTVFCTLHTKDRGCYRICRIMGLSAVCLDLLSVTVSAE